jgi:hypothetical protein
MKQKPNDYQMDTTTTINTTTSTNNTLNNPQQYNHSYPLYPTAPSPLNALGIMKERMSATVTNTARTMATSNSKYDVSLIVNSLDHMVSAAADGFNNNTGWRLLEYNNSGGEQQWTGVSVGLFGECNSGKTFIASLLSGVPFENQSFATNTQGVCIKSSVMNDNNVMFIDSPGLSIQQCVTVEELDQCIQNHKKTEEFIQDLILQLSDFSIIVINKLSIDTHLLVKKIIQQKREKDSKNKYDSWTHLHIIHNMLHVNNTQELVQLQSSVQNMYSADSRRDQGVDFLFDEVNGIRHLFLMNNNTTEGATSNKQAITLLQKWITSINFRGAKRRETICDRVVNVCNDLKDKYFTNIRYIERQAQNDGMLVANKVDLEKPVTVRLKIGDIDITDGFEPRYFIEEKQKEFNITVELPGGKAFIKDLSFIEDGATLAGHTRYLLKGTKLSNSCTRRPKKKKDIKQNDGIKCDTRDIGPFGLLVQVPTEFTKKDPTFKWTEGTLIITFIKVLSLKERLIKL